MRLGALFPTGKARAEPVSNATAGGAYSFGSRMTPSGEVVTPTRAAQLMAVYACVRLLSESIACLPLSLYELKEDGRHVKAYNHRLYKLLHDQPNPEMTAFDFREVMMVHLLLWGNAYAQKIWNGRGDIIALYPLQPDRMRVDRDQETGRIVYYYNHGVDEANTMKDTIVTLDPDDVFHVHGLGFDGLGVAGLDPGGELAQLLQQGRGVPALLLQLRHFLGGLVALAFQGLYFCDELAAPAVELLKFLDGQLGVAVAQSFGQHFRLLLYQFEI